VEKIYDKFYALTGRRYHNFEYYGSKTADRVIVLMGCSAETV